MNKLEIARLVNTLAGTQGIIETTDGLTGYQSTLVTMIDQAYEDIQVYRPSWLFLQATVDIPLNETLNTYQPIGLSKITRILHNQQILKEVDYTRWLLESHTNKGKPTVWTYNPYSKEIEFNQLDGDYITTLQYQKVPDILANSFSIPVLPVEFHSLIAYKAVIDLGSYLGNPDLVSKYSLKYSFGIGQLLRSQTPPMHLKAPAFV